MKIRCLTRRECWRPGLPSHQDVIFLNDLGPGDVLNAYRSEYMQERIGVAPSLYCCLLWCVDDVPGNDLRTLYILCYIRLITVQIKYMVFLLTI